MRSLMRIVNRKEFLAMPWGTVYSSYRPCVFEGLYIKGENLGNDFITLNLVGNFDNSSTEDFLEGCADMEHGKHRAALFDDWGLDGTFGPDDELYAVYEIEDVQSLIGVLRGALICTTQPTPKET
jgi:hypothetical protein